MGDLKHIVFLLASELITTLPYFICQHSACLLESFDFRSWQTCV